MKTTPSRKGRKENHLTCQEHTSPYGTSISEPPQTLSLFPPYITHFLLSPAPTHPEYPTTHRIIRKSFRLLRRHMHTDSHTRSLTREAGGQEKQHGKEAMETPFIKRRLCTIHQ